MATSTDPTAPGGKLGDRVSPAPARVTLYELFPRHIQLLAALPGEVSQFEETGYGYEWRCQCRLGPVPAGDDGATAELQLHFSLVDLPAGTRPAAVLYLVEGQPGADGPRRRLLPLQDLADTQELINGELARRGATVGIMEEADRFIRQLARVRDGLGEDVDWVSNPE